MYRSHSHFSARKDSIEETFRPCEPTKRTKRLYVPESVNDTDRVFSEYDWNNQTYTTTLRSNPKCPPAPKFPHVANFDSTIAPKSLSSQTVQLTETSTSIPRVSPRQNSRGVPDEALISSLLLSSSLSTSDDASCQHYNYPSSPIACPDTMSSPLEQSVMANAEIEREVQLPPSPSARAVRSLRSDSRKTMVGEVASSRPSTQDFGSSRRNRSCTWSSDVTAVEISEGEPKSFAYEDTDGEVYNSWTSDIWRTRGEEVRRRSLRGMGMSIQPHPAFDFDEAMEDQNAEGDGEEEETRKETCVNNIISAIHYRYVSVGLKVQLAVHRTEKKVARKLSDRRKN